MQQGRSLLIEARQLSSLLVTDGDPLPKIRASLASLQLHHRLNSQALAY